jgi:hypothetical protein
MPELVTSAYPRLQPSWPCYNDSCLAASCARNIIGVTFSIEISLKLGFFASLP